MYKLKNADVKNVVIIMLFFAILISIYTGSKAGTFYKKELPVKSIDTIKLEMPDQNIGNDPKEDLSNLLRHV